MKTHPRPTVIKQDHIERRISQVASDNMVLSSVLRWHWVKNGACRPVVLTWDPEFQPCNQVPAHAGRMRLLMTILQPVTCRLQVIFQSISTGWVSHVYWDFVKDATTDVMT